MQQRLFAYLYTTGKAYSTRTVSLTVTLQYEYEYKYGTDVPVRRTCTSTVPVRTGTSTGSTQAYRKYTVQTVDKTDMHTVRTRTESTRTAVQKVLYVYCIIFTESSVFVCSKK